MRRTVAVVCIAFGVFCLVLAPLLRFWMASAVMKTPMDYYSKSVIEGSDATYFSAEDLELVEGANVEANMTIRADVDASDEETVVWDQFMWVRDIDRDYAFQSSTRRTAHDRVTGEAVDCCDAAVNEEATVQSGQAFKWPFNVEQRDYEFFDTTTRRNLPIRFEGVEEVEGVEAYKFVQVIDPFPVETRDFPKSLLGLEGEGDVTAEVLFSNIRTYWVDPVTGSPLDLSEEQRRVATVDGRERLVMFDGVLSFSDETVAASIENAASGDLIVLLRTTLPITLLAVGAAMVVFGGISYISREAPNRARR